MIKKMKIHMRKYAALILLFSLCAGIAGFFLRRYELMTAFEPLSGLAVRGATATILLGALTLCFFLAVIAFAVFASPRHNKAKNPTASSPSAAVSADAQDMPGNGSDGADSPQEAAGAPTAATPTDIPPDKPPVDFENTFSTNGILYPSANILIGLLLMLGAVLHLLNLRVADMLQKTDVYFVVLSLLAAASIILSAVELFQNPKHKYVYALSIAPIAFLCFWLIMLYRANAANPVLLDYVYQCLAIVFSTLSFYYTAGFLYGKSSPGKAIVSYCGTIYLCFVALAEDFGMGMTLIFCAIIAHAAIHLFMLARNLQRKH